MDTYQLAELGVNLFYGFGHSVVVLFPLALIMPFLWKTKGDVAQRFLVFLITIAIIILGFYPMMFIISLVFNPISDYYAANTPHYRQSINMGHALLLFGTIISLCCLVALWVQKRMLGSQKPKVFSKSTPPA